MGVPFLGMVPINMKLRANSDLGRPTANFTEDPQLAKELNAVVRKLAGQISLRSRAGAAGPSLTVR